MLQYYRNQYQPAAICRVRRPSVMAIAAAALLLLALGLAGSGCNRGETPIFTPAPLPTPTAQPVSLLYDWFHAEQKRNPVRFDRMMEDEGRYGFTGIVSKIDGDKVQFHLSRRSLKRDDYVECRFKSEDDVVRFSVGETVTLYGNIAEVGRIVKFEECRAG